MQKDDLIAEAINLGLGKDKDLLKLSKAELQELINTGVQEPVKPQVFNPPKHDYYRG